MTLPTSKLPFLNCITDVLLIQVPSGKIRIGGFLGSDTCCRSLFATASLSLTSDLSNQMCGDALASALCRIPRNPPCRWPICRTTVIDDHFCVFMNSFYIWCKFIHSPRVMWIIKEMLLPIFSLQEIWQNNKKFNRSVTQWTTFMDTSH